VPAWFPGCIDTQFGGYRVNMTDDCTWQDGTERFLVSQARTLWFLSQLMRSPYGSPQFREHARHGFTFLSERMWDQDNGGFFWEVDARTGEALRGGKDLYGQSFALLALSEFALASGSGEAAARAADLFEVMEAKAHDDRYGGYGEMFARDWDSVPADRYLGGDSGLKTMNTHLHLLEAVTSYYRLSGETRAKNRLEELREIQSACVFREAFGASTELHKRDWEPLPGRWNRTAYGHDLENIFLLQDASSALGEEDLMMRHHRLAFDSCLQDGLDRKNGGFFYWGRFSRPATRRQKAWWVQADALVTCLEMLGLTGDSGAASLYLQTLNWVVTRQIDWAHGEWHREVLPNGRPAGPKAGPMKCCYHNGRAMLRCLAAIESRAAEAR
jgi:mannobiose 2-epimerase